MEKETKETALEFGKWAVKKFWNWSEVQKLWINPYSEEIVTDDEIWKLFENRNH